MNREKIAFSDIYPMDKIVAVVEGSFVTGSVPAGDHYSYTIANPIPGDVYLPLGLYQRNGGEWFGDLSHPVINVTGVDYTKIADIMPIVTTTNIIIRVGQYGLVAGDTINYKIALLWSGL